MPSLAYTITDLALHSPTDATQTKRAYSDLLSSSHWIERLGRISILGDDVARGTSGHRVDAEHYGSTGCVNALDWEREGLNRLASAGDDTKINIWTPGAIPQSNPLQNVTSPTLHLGLTDVIDTGHTANIFSVKWAPGDANKLFSCAGDETARVFDLNLSTNSNLSARTIRPTAESLHLPWNHYDSGSACERVFRCHTNRVKRIATEQNSQVFLTCSEDGTVRQHDLRTTHNCRRTTRSEPSPGCGPPLIDYSQVGLDLYSLSLSKLRPHLLLVAGTSSHAFLHDRRMLRKPMFQDWGVNPTKGALSQCVRRFGLPEERRHIVAAQMSEFYANELILSYSGGPVCLFNTEDEASVPEAEKDTEKPNEDAVLDASPAAISPSELKKRKREEEENSIGPHLTEAAGKAEPAEDDVMHGNEAEDDENDVDQSQEEEDSDEEFSDQDDDQEISSPAAQALHKEIPLIKPRQTFTGHANTQTVKDVNFAFRDDVIVSGSDDGNVFAWSKKDGILRAIFHADSSVCNVIEPHPRLPILAVSGIDPTVSIFGPNLNAEQRKNLITEKEEITARNQTRRRENIPAWDALDAHTARVILRRLMSQIPDGEESAEPGTRRIVINPEDVGDCILM